MESTIEFHTCEGQQEYSSNFKSIQFNSLYLISTGWQSPQNDAFDALENNELSTASCHEALH